MDRSMRETDTLEMKLVRNWWLLMLRGIAAIIFGLLALTWPGVTLLTLILFYGVYMFTDGILALGAAISGRNRMLPTWWLVMAGLLGIAVGLGTFLWPGITAIALIMLIGAASFLHGIFEIVGAIELRKEINDEWLLIAGGILSVIFGSVVMAVPGAGALAMVWMIGAYAILFGSLLVGLSLRLHSRGSGIGMRGGSSRLTAGRV